MKTPPFLLGSALVFWGWQTGFLIPGVIMGLTLEAARVIHARWEISDDDFSRIWTFCLVVLLATAVYAFTANEGPSDFRGFLHNPSFLTQRNAGLATARTTSSLLRWLPMIFFAFVAAQAYSSRDGIPLHVISMILRHRMKMARKLGLRTPISRTFNSAYPFFGLSLFSASLHSSDDTTFFWGFCLLMAWALWPQRSPRFALLLWAGALAFVIGMSYFGQRGIGQFQSYLGNLNTQWLGAFTRRRFDPIQSQTEIGNLGRIKTSPKIVIRLQAASGVPPRRLREATYRVFKGRTWYSESTENDFSRVAETNETTFPLLDRPTTDTVRIACYLPGGKALLPLPVGVGRLEHLMAYNVWKSPLGAVLEEGPGLVVFDALYGLGDTLGSPPGQTNEDLSIPERDEPTLQQVVSELNLKGQNADEAVKTLARFFSTQFTYSTWHEEKALQRFETPLSRFLLHSRSGHCEYFASAAVLLLRSIHIPARYAVGYAVHEGSGQDYVVRQRDAHAWCLWWDERHRAWRDFDPTPATWVAADGLEVSVSQKLSDFWGRIAFEISKFRWGQSHVRQYLLWTLLPVLGLLLYQIIFRKRRRWAGKGTKPGPMITWPGLDSEFYELEQRLGTRGLSRQASEPLSEWLRRIAKDETMLELRSSLREVLTLHYRYRFDPAGLTVNERERLRDKAKACCAQLDEHEAVATSA
jgi:transglutaminase-like putative cysteine protease